MKKIESLLFLLPVILFSSCFTSQLSYKKMNNIQRGMSPKEVIAVLGEPSYRSFNDKGEILEFRDYEYSASKVIKIWFVDNKVVEMKGYLDRCDSGCANRPKAAKSDEKKEKASDEETSSTKVRVTTDGKHVIQIGSLVVTPDGKHETVVSDAGGVIVTASGEHIHVF